MWYFKFWPLNNCMIIPTDVANFKDSATCRNHLQNMILVQILEPYLKIWFHHQNENCVHLQSKVRTSTLKQEIIPALNTRKAKKENSNGTNRISNFTFPTLKEKCILKHKEKSNKVLIHHKWISMKHKRNIITKFQ